MLLIVVALVPAMILIGFSGIEQRRGDRLKAEHRALDLASNLSAVYKQEIKNAINLLFLTKHIPSFFIHDISACSKILHNIYNSHPKYTGFSVALPTGDIITSVPQTGRSLNLSDRKWFQKVTETRSPVIGEYMIGRISGEPTMVAAFPLLDEMNRVRTIVTCGLGMDWLYQFIREFDLPEDTIIRIFSHDGMVLLSTQEPENLVGKSFQDQPVFKIMSGKEEGSFEEPGIDGIRRLYGFKRMTQSGIEVYVKVGISAKEAYAPATRTMVRNITVLSVILGAALVITWFFGGLLVVHPANALLHATQKLSGGDLTARARVDSGSGEIAAIGQAFNRMAGTLEQREKQIKEHNALINGINRILSATLTSKTDSEVANECLTTAEALTNSKFGFICEVNLMGRFDTIAISDPGWAACRIPKTNGVRMVNDVEIRGIRGKILKEGASRIFNTPSSHPDWIEPPEGHPSISSFLGVPLKKGNKVIGMIGLGNKEDGYTERDLRVIEEMSVTFLEAVMHCRTERQAKDFLFLIEQSKDLIGMASLDGKGLYLNQAGLALLGLDRLEAFQGTPLRTYVMEEDLEHFQKELLPALLKDQSWTGEFRVRNMKTGKPVPMEFNAFLVKDPVSGTPVSMAAVMRDITDRKAAEAALQAEKERFRILTEESPFGLALIDGEGNYRYLNPRFTAIFGYTLDDIPMGKEWFTKAFPDENYRKEVMSSWVNDLEVFGTETFRSQIFKVTCKDRSEKVIEFLPVMLNTGEHLVIYEDITDKWWAEQRVKEVEEKYKQVVNSVQEVFYMGLIDEKEEYYPLSFVSPHAEKVFGVHPQAFVEDPRIWFRSIHPEDLDALSVQTELSLKTGKAVLRTYRIQHQETGDYRWLEDQFNPLSDEKGRIVGFFGAARDVTERKELEQVVSKSEELMKTMGEVAKIGGWELNFETNTLFWTDQTKKIHEVPADYEPVVEKAIEFYSPESRPVIAETVRLAKEEGKPYNLELKLVTAQRNPICVRSIGQAEFKEGRCFRLYGAIQDITERKKLEENFMQAQKMEAIGRLAGGVAHDFNNMLGVILGYAQMMLMDLPEDSPDHGRVEQIIKATERAAALTRQLLAFSRKQIIQPEVLNINTVIGDLEKMVKRLLGEDIAFSVISKSDPCPIKIDPGQLEQILMNLCVNARDAMPVGGQIFIETANVDLTETYANEHGIKLEPGPYVLLSVSDTGIGMNKETQSRVFEPFFTTKGIGKGTGLGLATVYGIVKQNNGLVWVYSELGQGTTFKIYFPRARGPVKTSKAEQALPGSPHGTETVLVVEDDAQLRSAIKTILERYGYRVMEAESGEAALSLYRKHEAPVHLLVTDVIMPGMNGRVLAESLESLQPGIKVLFMSGYTDNAITHHGVLDPHFAFIEKPFSMQDLIRKVRRILDDKGQETPA